MNERAYDLHEVRKFYLRFLAIGTGVNLIGGIGFVLLGMAAGPAGIGPIMMAAPLIVTSLFFAGFVSGRWIIEAKVVKRIQGVEDSITRTKVDIPDLVTSNNQTGDSSADSLAETIRRLSKVLLAYMLIATAVILCFSALSLFLTYYNETNGSVVSSQYLSDSNGSLAPETENLLFFTLLPFSIVCMSFCIGITTKGTQWLKTFATQNFRFKSDVYNLIPPGAGARLNLGRVMVAITIVLPILCYLFPSFVENYL
jgi:hypothetical protein